MMLMHSTPYLSTSPPSQSGGPARRSWSKPDVLWTLSFALAILLHGLLFPPHLLQKPPRSRDIPSKMSPSPEHRGTHHIPLPAFLFSLYCSISNREHSLVICLSGIHQHPPHLEGKMLEDKGFCCCCTPGTQSSPSSSGR